MRTGLVAWAFTRFSRNGRCKHAAQYYSRASNFTRCKSYRSIFIHFNADLAPAFEIDQVRQKHAAGCICLRAVQSLVLTAQEIFDVVRAFSHRSKDLCIPLGPATQEILKEIKWVLDRVPVAGEVHPVQSGAGTLQ